MDLGSMGLGFLLGILSTSFGALVQHRLTAGDQERALRRALVAELRENLAVARFHANGVSSGGRLHRSAWDSARALRLSDKVFNSVAAAYAAADKYDRQLENGGVWQGVMTETTASHEHALEALGKAPYPGGPA